MKHTKAPWHYAYGTVFTDENCTEIIAVADRAGDCKIRPVTRDANMRLCSAAPDLLKVAVIARAWLQAAIDDGTHADRARADLKLVEEAIIKATRED